MKSLLQQFANVGKRYMPLSAEEVLAKPSSVVLASFANKSTHETWKLLSDNTTIGGSSFATFGLVEEGGEKFGRFEGVLSKEVESNQRRVRSGFAAIKGPTFDPLFPLSEHGHVEVRARCLNGRNYVLNVKVESFNHEDIYQALLEMSPSTEWRTLSVPFDRLVLTGRGRVREVQRKLDGDALLESLGILIADEKDGPFRLDLQYISISP